LRKVVFMRLNRIITVVDSHTAGEPARIVTSEGYRIKGKTMNEKMAYFKENLDDLRRTVILEPRGHSGMFSVFLTTATTPEADLGVLYLDVQGYVDMCIHGAIATATVAVETGLVAAQEPETTVVLDTVAGLVKAKARLSDGKVKEVTIRNVPSFLYRSDIRLDVPGVGKVKADIAYGGNFFAIVDSQQLNLGVSPSNLRRLLQVGVKIRAAAADNVKVRHPTEKQIDQVRFAQIYDHAKHPEADSRNIVVGVKGSYDRSPCGTGTCARMASLYAKGKLALNQEFTYESILGTIFRAKVIGETTVGDYLAVIPEVTGSAYITGFNQFVVDPEDPLPNGFFLD